jgi:hypothetical protein
MSDEGAPCYRRPILVAGVLLKWDPSASRHYRCHACGGRAVLPPPPESALREAYSSADPPAWHTCHDRSDEEAFAARRELLERFSPGRAILEVGCFDGSFLSTLDASWHKHAVEPA